MVYRKAHVHYTRHALQYPSTLPRDNFITRPPAKECSLYSSISFPNSYLGGLNEIYPSAKLHRL